MAQEYSDVSRESDPYALPDLEVFEVRRNGTPWEDSDGNRLESGFYWWSCLPGCLPDSDPIGPFDTYADALADAREGFES